MIGHLAQFEVYRRFFAFRAGECEQLLQLPEGFRAVAFGHDDLGAQDVGAESQVGVAERKSDVAAFV